jgi:hypothetical protein
MSRKTIADEELVTIHVGVYSTGAAYELTPLSRRRVEKSFPEAEGVPLVFLGFKQPGDFERHHRPLWLQVGALLTGLSPEQIGRLDGLRIYRPRTRTVVWEWRASATKTA